MKTKFELGDKVKFLNQTGGGIVTKVTDDFVFVQDDTGFDIPMQPEELIRMADQKGAGKLFNATMEEHLKGKQITSVFDSTSKAAEALKKAIPLTPEEEIKQLKEMLDEPLAPKNVYFLEVNPMPSIRTFNNDFLYSYNNLPPDGEICQVIDTIGSLWQDTSLNTVLLVCSMLSEFKARCRK